MHLSQPAVTERVRKLEAAGVITGYRATVDLGRLGYGIRALIRIGRAEYARVVKLIQQTPECINAYNVTGEDSWVLEIAVIDVAHLDAVVSKFCILTETATSIILNPAREHQAMLPPRREDVKPHQESDPRMSTTTDFAACDLCDAHKAGYAEGDAAFRVLPPVFASYGGRARFCGPVLTVKVLRGQLAGEGRARIGQRGPRARRRRRRLAAPR